MPDKPTKQSNPDDTPIISFAEVAKTEKPEAPSLAKERAERDRARRAENDAAARNDNRALPVTPIPPD
jgi:hypothetical protein